MVSPSQLCSHAWSPFAIHGPPLVWGVSRLRSGPGRMKLAWQSAVPSVQSGLKQWHLGEVTESGTCSLVIIPPGDTSECQEAVLRFNTLGHRAVGEAKTY